MVWFVKVYVDTLVKKAYENWLHVIEYDGKSLVNLHQNKGSGTSISEFMEHPQDYSDIFDQQLPVTTLPASVPGDQPTANSGGL